MKHSILIPTLAMAAAMLVNGCSGGAKKNAGSAGVPVLVAQAVETNVPVQINPPPVGHVMAVFDGDHPPANGRHHQPGAFSGRPGGQKGRPVVHD